MYDLQIITERIMLVAEQQHLSKNKLLANVNLSKSIFDNMKKGSYPSVDKIAKIADYLNCSVDYLLGRTDNPEFHPQKLVPAHFEDVFLAAHGGDIHVPDTYETSPAARKLIDDIFNREAENEN